MKDAHKSYRIKKETLFDLPMKLMIVGKSQLAGKTNLLANLLLRPYDKTDIEGSECYFHDFEGRNIYIISPSIGIDKKLDEIIMLKQIPSGNLMTRYNESEITRLYEFLEERFMGTAPQDREHVLVVMDDCSFSGSLKDKINGAVARLFMNGRHILVSTIVTAQKYSDILTGARENCTGCMLFGCTPKQRDLIYEDHGKINKSKFGKIYDKTTREPHSFMIVNYSNPPDSRYMDQYGIPIPELCNNEFTD